MIAYVVRIFVRQEVVFESESMLTLAQGLTALAMFEDLYADFGFRISKSCGRRRHFRAFHTGDGILLDVYLTEMVQSMN